MTAILILIALSECSPMSEKLRKSRAVRLTADVDARLQAVCEHLGTNPNAYLLLAVGRAVAQDEVVLNAKNNNAGIYEQMGEMFRSLVEEGPSEA